MFSDGLFLLAAIKTIRQRVNNAICPAAVGRVCFAHADAFQTDDAQADQFAHAADLAFFALSQNKAQLVFVLPFYFGGTQFLSVQTQSVVEQGKSFFRPISPRYAYQIFLFHCRCFSPISCLAMRPSCVNTSNPTESMSSLPAGAKPICVFR